MYLVFFFKEKNLFRKQFTRMPWESPYNTATLTCLVGAVIEYGIPIIISID